MEGVALDLQAEKQRFKNLTAPKAPEIEDGSRVRVLCGSAEALARLTVVDGDGLLPGRAALGTHFRCLEGGHGDSLQMP